MVRNHARKEAARGARGADRTHRQAVDAVRHDTPAVGRAPVAPGDAVPRDETGFPECPLRRGDVLRISCPAGQARVVETWGDNAVALIRWPWQEQGADEPNDFAVDLPPSGPARFSAPFRHTPLARGVREGDILTVDLPPTVVHVAYTSDVWLADDRDAGRPPADSHMNVAVFPYGVSESDETMREGADQRWILRPWAAAPMTVELIHRPYPALESGDRVRDAHGTVWQYAPHGGPGVAAHPQRAVLQRTGAGRGRGGGGHHRDRIARGGAEPPAPGLRRRSRRVRAGRGPRRARRGPEGRTRPAGLSLLPGLLRPPVRHRGLRLLHGPGAGLQRLAHRRVVRRPPRPLHPHGPPGDLGRRTVRTGDPAGRREGLPRPDVPGEPRPARLPQLPLRLLGPGMAGADRLRHRDEPAHRLLRPPRHHRARRPAGRDDHPAAHQPRSGGGRPDVVARPQGVPEHQDRAVGGRHRLDPLLPGPPGPHLRDARHLDAPGLRRQEAVRGLP